MNPELSLQNIVLLNFGGLGDELLFSPVIQTIRHAYPRAHLTLILESRSAAIQSFLPELNTIISLDVQSMSRMKLFLKLLGLLRRNHYDAVVASGSSPFIAILLKLSGIGIRIGFDTGWLSYCLLTYPAPLDRTRYASQMYYNLAKTLLSVVQPYHPVLSNPAPHFQVSKPTIYHACQILEEAGAPSSGQRIFLHPGVSRLSAEKNVLKSWPIEHWKRLISILPDRYPQVTVAILGGPDDEEVIEALELHRLSLPENQRAQVFNLYGKTKSIVDLAGLIRISDVLVCVDSAPMHIAIGLGTPVVAIFGPTDENKLLPKRENVMVVSRDNLSCRPCLWDVRQTSCENPICLNVPVEKVLEKLDSLFIFPINPIIQ